jgi:tetratricopeptide (TPR) repeat protein
MGGLIALETALPDTEEKHLRRVSCLATIRSMATISEALRIAVEHHQAGRLGVAEQIYLRILAVQPDHVDALHLLGVVAYQVVKHEVAIACLQRAMIRLKPDYAEAHNDLGNAFGSRGKLDEAIACYRQVVQLELGSALGGRADHGRSAAWRQRAAHARPRYAEMCSLFGKALGQLATILQSRLPEDDLHAMRQLLSEADLGDDDRAALEFGLAQVLDAQGNYREAADPLVQANAARRAALARQERGYIPDHYRSFVAGLAATFTPQLFA